jgi:hypothetical protein
MGRRQTADAFYLVGHFGAAAAQAGLFFFLQNYILNFFIIAVR